MAFYMLKRPFYGGKFGRFRHDRGPVEIPDALKKQIPKDAEKVTSKNLLLELDDELSPERPRALSEMAKTVNPKDPAKTLEEKA